MLKTLNITKKGKKKKINRTVLYISDSSDDEYEYEDKNNIVKTKLKRKNTNFNNYYKNAIKNN